MKSYKYIALDLLGLRKEGLKEASCSMDVLSWLRDQELTPVSVYLVSNDTDRKKIRHRRSKIKSSELSAFCWQLTTMIEGGITIINALETITEDIDNPYLKYIIQQCVLKMNKGETFSSTISAFPKIFNNLSVAIILAGESSGDLAGALYKLAEYFDSRDKLAKKIQGAAAYPTFVFTFIVLMVIFIMAFIIPRFQAIFRQSGAKLPAFTQIFMSAYDAVCNNLFLIIGSVALLVVFGFSLYHKTRQGHYIFGKIKLKLPFIGKLSKQAFLVVFCKTMATLLSAGVPVLEVFDILAAMSENDIIKSATTKSKESVVQGLNISTSMDTTKFFPAMVINMVLVGEKSGSLPKVLERTAKYYERKIDTMITTLTSMLEPIMIISVGAIVLVVVLALYLPVFSMSNITR